MRDRFYKILAYKGEGGILHSNHNNNKCVLEKQDKDKATEGIIRSKKRQINCCPTIKKLVRIGKELKTMNLRKKKISKKNH